MTYRIIQGDVLETLRKLPDSFAHGLFCDPPYGIAYMGKEWDRMPPVEVWREAFRVLKPGAWLIAYASTRTLHTMATNIEAGGFEIRDTLLWLYLKSMPKGPANLGLRVDDAIGVASEVVGTRKFTGNASKMEGRKDVGSYCPGNASGGTAYGPVKTPSSSQGKQWDGYVTCLKQQYEPLVLARKPLDGTYVDSLLTHGTGAIDAKVTQRDGDGRWPANITQEEGATPWFFAPKVSRKERDYGLDHLPDRTVLECVDREDLSSANPSAGAGRAGSARIKNHHPTLKPITCSRHWASLIRPNVPDATLLVPFSGAGSEIIGALLAGWPRVLGIEGSSEYIEIAEERVKAWIKP